MSGPPCDEVWVERQIQEGLLDELPPMGVGRRVPEEYFTRFQDVFPWSFLYVWRRFGFEGFGEGRFWITDPLQWQPVVDAWLDGVEIPFEDQRWYCVARTAMGSMSLWGEKSGPALEVMPVRGQIHPSFLDERGMSDPLLRDRAGCIVFANPLEDNFFDEVSQKPVVDVVVGRLGAVSADEVFGFVPAFFFTGRMEAQLVTIENAEAHLIFLAETGRVEVMPDLIAENWEYLGAFLAEHDSAGDLQE